MKRVPFFNTTRIVMIALFGALAGVLHAFGKFPIAVAFPSFLELDFSDIPLFIGTFALGPVSGCLIVVVKILVKLVCVGTSTVFVGDLANLLIGFGFVIPAGILYKHFRTIKGALLSLAVGTVSSITVAILSNWLLLIPFYITNMFDGSWEPLLGMMRPLFPSVTKDTFYGFYLWVSVLPFNAMRCLIASLVTLLVYKHISRAIDRINDKLSPEEEGKTKVCARDIAVATVCIVLVLLLLLFALLRYFLWS